MFLMVCNVSTFNAPDSAFTLADKYKLSRKVKADSQCPPKIDSALQAGLQKRPKPSFTKLRCRVGTSGERERKALLEHEARVKGISMS